MQLLSPLVIATMFAARLCSALRIIIVQHAKEALRPTSTWRLLQPYANVELLTWHGREDNESLSKSLSELDSSSLVWPTGGARQSPVADLQDQTVVILDGTWSEADRMFRKGPDLLRSMGRVEIEPRSPSIYKLRRDFGFVAKYGGAKSNLLCTAEVGAELLRSIGEEEQASRVLEDLAVMQRAVLAGGSKGREEPQEIEGGGEDEGEGEGSQGAEEKPSLVYLLQSVDGRSTYIGATKNMHRRLRQHNGEIAGGARATRRRSGQWQVACTIQGFPSWSAALSFEWRWKRLSRGAVGKGALGKRRAALDQLLGLERSTSKAVPFSSWEQPPLAVWHD